MTSNVSNSSRCTATVVGAAIITFGLGLLFVAVAASRTAQTQSSATSKSSNSPGGGHLVVIGTDVRDKTIDFGDELVVLVTLQNQGNEAIRIPPNVLRLKNVGWSGFPGGGSGLGEAALARAGVYGKEEFTLSAGESVTLSGSNIEMAAKSLGPMKANFIIEIRDESLSRAAGKLAGFAVSYDVAPSKLMISAWSTKTPEDGLRLQSQIRDLLLIDTSGDGWRNRLYVEAARVTIANPGRIEDLDWLDDRTLIYDRLQPDDRHSTLRTVSLR